MPFLKPHIIMIPIIASLTACSMPASPLPTPRSGQASPAPTAANPAGSPRTVGRTETPAPIAAAPGRTPAAGLIGPDGASLVSRDAAGLVGMDGASLAGVVRLPAGLVGPDGASLIGPDGASLVGPDGASIVAAGAGNVLSHNGAQIVAAGGLNMVAAGAGNFRLRQADAGERPVVRAQVYLVDARGRLVTGADGAPLATTTDAAGRFAFQGVTATRNLLVAVPLAKGAVLRTLLPRGAGSRDDLAVDLAATIATRYIEATFVNGAADPGATLDRLEAGAAAEARRLAAAGLEAGRVARPTVLADQTLVGTATALRAADPAFDTHMAAVARMLAAGQANMGAGRPGTEVGLAGVASLAASGDGLLIAASDDHRVWRLGPDGRLDVYAGAGKPDLGKLVAGPAVDAPLKSPLGLVSDPAGGAVLLEWLGELQGRRVSRLTAAGQLLPVPAGLETAWAVPGAAGTVIVGEFGVPATTWAIAASGERRKLHELPATATRAFTDLRRYGIGADGRVYLGGGPAGDPAQGAVWRYDPASGAFDQVLAPGERRGLTLAAGGELLVLDRAGRLTLQTPDGTTRELLAAAPASFALAWDGAAVARDGTVHLAAGRERVWRLHDGALTLVAGRPAPASQAADLALQDPAGLATAPDGTIWIADRGAHRILRVAPDGAVTPVAGTGEAGSEGDGGPATIAQLSKPGALRRDAAGNLYVVEELGYDQRRLRRIGADGRIATWFETAALVTGLAVTADGTAYLATYESVGEGDVRVALRRIAPDGKADAPLLEDARLGAQLTLALDADGASVLLWGNGTIHTWHPERGLAQDAIAVPGLGSFENLSGLAVAADGTLYAALDRTNVVVRIDRATGASTPIAGPGTGLLGGAGVDDGLETPGYLTFAASGELLVSDTRHRQLKRLPADKLR